MHDPLKNTAHATTADAPRLSVVMSVFNGEATIGTTLDSIAAQTFRDYELIVVDDGSTDSTPAILRDRAARDPRIRVITQQNGGLTRALIRGCAAARAPLIARHDDGDVSMPERFAKQLALFDDDAVVLASSWTRFVGPEGEWLYDVAPDAGAIAESLRTSDVTTIRGLSHHGTAMFRRDAYLAAGGYRAEFRYAQDLDLWLRLTTHGRIAVVPEVLYEARFAVAAISASRREEQIALATIALALRDAPASHAPHLLDEARRLSAAPRQSQRASRTRAAALYFVASCLRRNGDARFRRYARAAVRSNPLSPRPWLLLLRGLHR